MWLDFTSSWTVEFILTSPKSCGKKKIANYFVGKFKLKLKSNKSRRKQSLLVIFITYNTMWI